MTHLAQAPSALGLGVAGVGAFGSVVGLVGAIFFGPATPEQRSGWRRSATNAPLLLFAFDHLRTWAVVLAAGLALQVPILLLEPPWG